MPSSAKVKVVFGIAVGFPWELLFPLQLTTGLVYVRKSDATKSPIWTQTDVVISACISVEVLVKYDLVMT